MKIAEGLNILEIKVEGDEGVTVFCPVLIWDEVGCILVDAAVPGQLEAIRREMKKVRQDFEKLKNVIVTHHDLDHIGSLSSIVRASGGRVKVLSHEAEKPYIQGDKISIKMTPERIAQLDEKLKAMPEDERNEHIRMRESVKCRVDVLIEDGEELPLCGGIIAIHTPGHTPGHLCLYVKKYKTLIAGDAMNVKEGKLVGPNPKYTYNMEEAINSLKKLGKYDIQTVLCYHGGAFNRNVNERIAELSIE